MQVHVSCKSSLLTPRLAKLLLLSLYRRSRRTREVHASPHGLLLIDIVRLLSKSEIPLSRHQSVTLFSRGFTGLIYKIVNKIKAPHGFTGLEGQRGVLCPSRNPLNLFDQISPSRSVSLSLAFSRLTVSEVL